MTFVTQKESDVIDGEEGAASNEKFDWNTWEPIITAVTILASVLAFFIGFISIRRKRSKLRKHMDNIDETFNSYKKNVQVCSKQLVDLRESIKAEVRDGKIEESHFLILDKKIGDYLVEIESEEDAKLERTIEKKKIDKEPQKDDVKETSKESKKKDPKPPPESGKENKDTVKSEKETRSKDKPKKKTSPSSKTKKE